MADRIKKSKAITSIDFLSPVVDKMNKKTVLRYFYQARNGFRHPHAPLLVAMYLLFYSVSALAAPPLPPRAAALLNNVAPRVELEMQQKGLTLGQPLFIRIFKIPGTLELWVKKNSRYKLFKSFPICCYSGYPGPKLQEGDWQSPEGFYTVTAPQMNPNSNYHLSFNIGYPNDFDRTRKRTGSAIMVHGGCSSRGCFAMGDAAIDEIYLLAQSALAQGQKQFPVHIFPFKLTENNLFKYRSSPWIDFWKKLRPGFVAFERNRRVPDIVVKQGNYVLQTKNVQIAMADTDTKEGKK